MPTIMEIIRERQQQRQGVSPNRQGLRAGIVVSVGSPMILVNDGVSSVQCLQGVDQQLRPGDRVWIGTGDGVAIILGVAGSDLNLV